MDSTHPSEPNARVLTPLLAALTALTSLSIDMKPQFRPPRLHSFIKTVTATRLGGRNCSQPFRHQLREQRKSVDAKLISVAMN